MAYSRNVLQINRKKYVPQALIVLTNGHANNINQVKIEAQKLKDDGVILFCVHLGPGKNPEGCKAITNNENDRIEEVDDDDAVEDIKEEMCEIIGMLFVDWKSIFEIY